MGTPDFAVVALDALVQHGFQVVAVVTNMDKPSGRGMRLQPSAVKTYAMKNNIPVLQPIKLKDRLFLEELASYKATLQVVVAFRMLPEEVWNMPPLGTINIHASLLPAYRGAAPINWAIMNGEIKTGISTFQLKHEIDTGDILLQKEVDILPDDDAGSLHDKLAVTGGELIVETLEALINGRLKASPQVFTTTDKMAPKIFKTDCLIDWNSTIKNLYNKIRGLSPYPAAFTELNNKKIKIYKTKMEPDSSLPPAGSIHTDGKSFVKIAGTDGWIHLLEIQLEGKKRMNIADFLRGNSLQ